MENALRGLVLGLLVALAGCGGGGDSTPARVSVGSDNYYAPTDTALQDRTFNTVRFTNHDSGALGVSARSTSTRTLTAPQNTGGTLYLFVSVLDETANELVFTDCRQGPFRVEAGAQLVVSEDMACALTLPGNHVYAFTPFARITADSKPASEFILRTTAYELTVQ